MSAWLDELLIFLLKKRACMRIRMIMTNKMQAEDNIKTKPVKTNKKDY